jgi:hypothetical protein
MEGTPHANLVICTPGHSLINSYVLSLLKLASALNDAKISFTWANDYSSHVADAREVTLSGTRDNSFFETKPFEGRLTYDKIMWIDSDIAFTPEDVLKLYRSDKDIITGAYLLAHGEVTAYKKREGEPYNYEEVKEMTDLVQIASAGMGFMCVKNGVFESLSRPWFQTAFHTVQINDKDYTYPITGEDTSFCHRALDAGFEIWFDPTVRVTHHKTMKLTWEGIKP